MKNHCTFVSPRLTIYTDRIYAHFCLTLYANILNKWRIEDMRGVFY